MEGEAILQTTAEVSVALAGFTGVVAAFSQRRGHWSAINMARFQLMLETSLAALVFSLLPFVLHNIGVEPTSTWAISSGLLAGYLVVGPWIGARRLRQLGGWKDSQVRKGLLVLAYSVVGVAVVSQVLNALSIGFDRAFGPFFLGLFCVLLICALVFVRLLSFVGPQPVEE